MTRIVYFSSASNNTARFVEKLDRPAARLPLRSGDPDIKADEPYVLIVPTYGGGNGEGAVPKQVIRFLNDPARRALIRGVIGTGNRNFGATFALAGRVIAGKCDVPLLDRIELAGTTNDVARVRAGLARFWGTVPMAQTGKLECLTTA